MNTIPTNTSELREQLRKCLGMCNDKSCASNCIRQLDAAMKLIEAHVQQEVPAARVDEIYETVISAGQYPIDRQYSRYPGYWVDVPDVERRLATLTQQEPTKGDI